MRYITHILLPGEDVLLNARIHPIILFPGAALTLLGLWLLLIYGHHAGETYALARFGRWLYEGSAHGRGMYAFCSILIDFGKSWGTDTKILGFILLFPGLKRLGKAIEIYSFTELVITTMRVIAKTGVIATTTVELDRRRITEVVVHQSMMGRVLNYGKVYLQGFAGGIDGLPVIAQPYMVQRALTTAAAI